MQVGESCDARFSFIMYEEGNVMKQIVSSEQMKQLDQYTIEQMGVPSLVLMERAALSVVDELRAKHNLSNVLVVCGSGNNGADGMAIARILWLQGFSVSVFLVGKKENFSKEAQIQWKILENYCIPIVNKCYYSEYTTIVDAIFGVGLSRIVSGHYKDVIKEINESHVPVVSVDIPSGIHGTTGQVMGDAIKAKTTVTFAYGKSGLYFYPGASYAGEIMVKDIGIYGNLNLALYAIDEAEWYWLPKRPADGNKGTYGKVLILAGSKDMCGAAYLSAKACLLSGAGMVKIFTAKDNRTALQQLLPEALITTYEETDCDIPVLECQTALEHSLCWADTILMGPGIGTSKTATWMLKYVLEHALEHSIVLDADALNILSRQKDYFYKTRQHLILTPHLGEMARISGYPIEELKKNPVQCLRNYGKLFEVSKTIVMKDARTLTLTEDETCYINLTGNSGMATAGSGDVLAGMIAGLLAQGMKPEHAAPFGVWLHGLAGDYMKERKGAYSMLASDLFEGISHLLKDKS